jgi:hypothetical protein
MAQNMIDLQVIIYLKFYKKLKFREGLFMKALFVMFVVSLIGLASFASPEGDYLVTKDGKMIVSKVKMGVFNLRAKLDDGSDLKVKYHDVNSYKKDGEVFEKKPLFLENKNTGKMVFMQLISRKNGYRLYKFNDNISGIKTHTRYYVFHDDNRFWLEVCCKNDETINKFFNE